MLKFKQIFGFLLLMLVVVSCSKDDNDTTTSDTFVVAFKTPSKSIEAIEANGEIPLVYSAAASANGTILVEVEATNLTYGVDFTTIPKAENNSISLPISSGQNGNTITFKNLTDKLNNGAEVTFTIVAIQYPNSVIQGYSKFTISSVSGGGVLAPKIGGPNEQNQVYIDLSTNTATSVRRDAWDLGFYGGDDFRVVLNGSIYMATAPLSETNIDAVTEASVADLQPKVAVGTFDLANKAYVDNPNGDITGTAIKEISANANDNPVYLLNLGYEVGTTEPQLGSVAVAGDKRGWKKIRILRDGDNYKLQYANLNETTHKEVVIPKSSTHNFNFFSFDTNATVSVEPQKQKWDLCFTVFTNVLEQDGGGSYGFSDFVLHNRKGNVVAYQVMEENGVTYDTFSLNNVIDSNFDKDQRAIGGNWRNLMPPNRDLHNNRFYILKDSEGNKYKLKFTALTNGNGVRGHSEFKYELLTTNNLKL